MRILPRLRRGARAARALQCGLTGLTGFCVEGWLTLKVTAGVWHMSAPVPARTTA
jgi:hypothetical protein